MYSVCVCTDSHCSVLMCCVCRCCMCRGVEAFCFLAGHDGVNEREEGG